MTIADRAVKAYQKLRQTLSPAHDSAGCGILVAAALIGIAEAVIEEAKKEADKTRHD